MPENDISLSLSLCVFIGELIRYARGCTYYEDFAKRALLLIKKLTKQAFTIKKLKAAYVKFTESHLILVQKYNSRVLNFPYNDSL